MQLRLSQRLDSQIEHAVSLDLSNSTIVVLVMLVSLGSKVFESMNMASFIAASSETRDP
jgi:hypothetical protein